MVTTTVKPNPNPNPNPDSRYHRRDSGPDYSYGAGGDSRQGTPYFPWLRLSIVLG